MRRERTRVARATMAGPLLEVAIALRQSHRDGFVRVDLPLADRSLGILSSEIAQDETPGAGTAVAGFLNYSPDTGSTSREGWADE